MLSKRYESTEVDRRTWLHVPSGTHWSTSSDTHQVVEIQIETSTATSSFGDVSLNLSNVVAPNSRDVSRPFLKSLKTVAFSIVGDVSNNF